MKINKDNEKLVTQEYLKSLFSYDPETGFFKNKTMRLGAPLGSTAGSNKHGYCQIMISRKMYRSHRLVWLYMTGSWPVDQIDHINGNRSDNTFSNLRECTSLQNSRNRKINSTNLTGFKGIWADKWGKWRAKIVVNGKRINLGSHNSPEEAHEAYREASIKYYREFSKYDKVKI